MVDSLHERIRVHHFTVKSNASSIKLKALPGLLVRVYGLGYGWWCGGLVLHKSERVLFSRGNVIKKLPRLFVPLGVEQGAMLILALLGKIRVAE